MLYSFYICVMQKRAIVIGASGLIGSHLVEFLLLNDYQEIKLLVRKPLPYDNQKIQQKICDFGDLDLFSAEFKGYEHVFCAVGTTRKKTPNLQDYRKIDLDIPVNTIKFSEQHKVSSFMLVSSVGADAHSKNFYLQIKGEVEETLKTAEIPIKGTFQPSLLLGARKENRFGEGLARLIMPLFNFLIPKKYKAIEAHKVAAAMVWAAQHQTLRFKCYQYAEIIESQG